MLRAGWKLAMAVGIVGLLFLQPFQLVRNGSRGMEPTLAFGQRLIVNNLVYRLREPRAGDVVMIYYPVDPNKRLVQRVIAQGGDTIRIADGTVYVNEKPAHVGGGFRNPDRFGPQILPTGYYFVLGDNKTSSSDSRHWGFVPRRYIIGKVIL